MSRAVIQIGQDRIAYDGRNWTPIAGERAEALARMMKSDEWMYKHKAEPHPDYVYNVALAAARDWHGKIVEHEPHLPGPPGRIY